MQSDLLQQNLARVTRRQLFGRYGSGVGTAALASLLGNSGVSVLGDAPTPAKIVKSGLTDLPHHVAKAKRVVMFWQGGGASHVDLFDDKPVM